MFKLLRKPFEATIKIIKKKIWKQEQFIDFQNNSLVKDPFNSVDTITFWYKTATSYSKVAYCAMKSLLSYPTTYPCEELESDMQCANTKPRIKN